jgi:hypothetical protein
MPLPFGIVDNYQYLFALRKNPDYFFGTKTGQLIKTGDIGFVFNISGYINLNMYLSRNAGVFTEIAEPRKSSFLKTRI